MHKRVIVLWKDAHVYAGVVDDARANQHHVSYDDGEGKWYNLSTKTFWVVGDTFDDSGTTPTMAQHLAGDVGDCVRAAVAEVAEAMGLDVPSRVAAVDELMRATDEGANDASTSGNEPGGGKVAEVDAPLPGASAALPFGSLAPFGIQDSPAQYGQGAAAELGFETGIGVPPPMGGAPAGYHVPAGGVDTDDMVEVPMGDQPPSSARPAVPTNTGAWDGDMTSDAAPSSDQASEEAVDTDQVEPFFQV